MRNFMTILFAAALLASGAVAETADVQIIHNSPDPAAAAVDIYINGDAMPAIDDFAFRTATPVIQLPAGVELVIGVAPGSSSGPADIIAEFPVTLADGGRYLVMATGVLDGSLPGNPDGEDTAFTLRIFDGLTNDAPAGTTNLLVYHGSPDAPTVDVQVMMGPILIDDLAYGMFQGYLNAPATDLNLEITPGNDNSTVVKAYAAPLSALDGAGAVVFASGFLGSQSGLADFSLFVALGDGTVLELHEVSVATDAASWSSVKAMFQ
jgi:hypothetical protein